MNTPEQRRRYRARHKELGLCRNCPAPVSGASRLYCAKHKEIKKQASKTRRVRLHAAGLCHRCGKTPPLPSRVHCAPCTARYQVERHRRRGMRK